MRLLVGLGGLSLVSALVLGGAWLVEARRANDELAVQVAKVRARGEPLTTVELRDFYQPAPGRPDMTQEIMAALELCGADELKALAEKLPFVGKGEEPPPLPQEWAQIAEAESFLGRLAPAVATLRKVADVDGTARFPVDFGLGVLTPLPQRKSTRQGANVLSLQFYVHLHRGRTSDAVECLLSQISLARATDREPTFISQLAIPLTLMHVARRNTQALVRQAEVADSDLRRLQEALRNLDFQASVKRAIAGDGTYCYTACIDPGRMTEKAPFSAEEALQFAERRPKYIFDAARMLEQNLRIAEAAERSLLTAMRESDLVMNESAKLWAGSMLGKLKYSLTMRLSPTYGPFLAGFARAAAMRDCADTAFAAELYRRKQGKWPEKLDDLVPDYLPTVPIDAFSDLPLKTAATSDEFKVYSVSQDGKDDGGNLSDRIEPDTDIGFVYPLRPER